MVFQTPIWDLIGRDIEYVVDILIAALFIAFVLWYLWPAIRLSYKLNNIDKMIVKYKKDHDNRDVCSLEELNSIFSGSKLDNAWLEYRKTLHEEQVNGAIEDDFGSSYIVRYRATILAETYLSDANIVDSSINAEFFRHAPGIFTGFGIIGTFLGLIYGLSHFSISDDPHQAQIQLQELIHAVSAAFHASAAAIITAIVTTLVEKISVHMLYTRLSAIRETLDSLFKVGVGEEYLQRLKQSSETSQTQMLQVKDKLMEELKPFLAELAEQQFKRSTEHNAMIPSVFSTALKESLGEPLKQIASNVKQASSDQNDQVKTLLSDVLSAFSAKMQDVFGQQFTEMLNRTTEAMERVARDFSGLADRMGVQGDHVVSSMGNQLTQVIDQMNARQREMNDAMEGFVLELRKSVSEANTESQLQIQTMISALQKQVGEVLERVSQSAQQASAEQGALQQELRQQSTNALQSVQSHMGEVLARVQQSTQEAIHQQASLQKDLQTQSSAAMQMLGVQVSNALEKVHESTQAAMDGQAEAQGQWQQKAVTLLDGLNRQVQASVAATNEMTQAVQTAIAQLSETTIHAVRSLEVSAGNLSNGIDALNSSASNVTSAMSEGERFARKLEHVVTQFDHSLQATRNIATNYQEARLQFADSMNSLREVVENAKREASMTHQQIESMERASRLLNEAQTKIGNYVSEVSKVLGETHKVFADHVQKTIGDVNNKFTQSLSSAVNKVSSTVSELGDTLEKIDLRPKR